LRRYFFVGNAQFFCELIAGLLANKKTQQLPKKMRPEGFSVFAESIVKKSCQLLSCLRFFASLSYHKTAKRNKKLEPLANPRPQPYPSLSVAKGEDGEAGPRAARVNERTCGQVPGGRIG